MGVRKSPAETAQSKLLSNQVSIKAVSLKLPPAHVKQLELINAFNARRKPDGTVIYDPSTPGFESYSLAYPELRFIIGACGTKFGKTFGCAIKIVQEAWRNWDWNENKPLDHPGLYWWVAPTYKQAKNAFRQIVRMLPKGMFIPYNSQNDVHIDILNPDGSIHSTIEFKSADNEDSLRGFDVQFFIFDEAARGVSYEAFVSVMTTVTRTWGRGIIISTPNGQNWFYDEYLKGEKHTLLKGEVDENAEYISIRMPTWTNPHVPTKAIELLKKTLPKEVFDQEVAAIFMRNSAGVFILNPLCFKGAMNEDGTPVWGVPVPGRRYVMGVDLAKKRDWTVIFVADAQTRQVVYFKRMQRIGWGSQKHDIVRISQHYNNARVCIDATGLGDPICDDLRDMGVAVEGYIISPKSKTPLIDKLRVNLEFAKITMPQIDVVVKELKRYQYEISKNGTYTYSAPAGYHDDCVIGLALLNWILDIPPMVHSFVQIPGV